ncbi:MAG: hypothetical protein JWP13_875 [Candidatus Saccharibacteria bacterium]|nr:hypothetical protein [Candidatus Saccharibacteria bacterium]
MRQLSNVSSLEQSVSPEQPLSVKLTPDRTEAFIGTESLMHYVIGGQRVAVIVAPIPPPHTALMARRKRERPEQQNLD